jgi:hypothetical protein
LINRDSFPTGDFEIASNLTFEIIIPDIEWVKRVFLGTLFIPTQEHNWVQVGTATPDQAALTFIDIYASFEEEM